MLVQCCCGWRDMLDAAYYRAQAERARRLATVPTDRETKETLKRMAQDYSDIAEDLELGVEAKHVVQSRGGRLSAEG
jgi:hypothetical protein